MSALPGRTRITSKALSRVASAVAAETLSTEVRRVRVHLEDERGALSIRVSAPISLVALDRVAADRSIVDRSGGPLTTRIVRAQNDIGVRVGDLTGFTVSSVTVRITGADIEGERRVR